MRNERGWIVTSAVVMASMTAPAVRAGGECAECGDPSCHDCFEGNAAEPFCNDECDGVACAGCCAIVCRVDPYCCDAIWDAFCAVEAEALCGCQPKDAPANDDCEDAIPVELGVTEVSNECASADGPSHRTCTDGFVAGLGLDIWYSFAANFSGDLIITPSVDAGVWNTQLAVYEDCNCARLEDPPLACANVGAGLSVTVSDGACYLIRLGGTFDAPSGSGTLELTTDAGCAQDLDGDGIVGMSDMMLLISAWGTDPGGPPDFDGDGNVGTADLIELLGAWGPCR